MKKCFFTVIATVLLSIPCAVNAQNDDFKRHEVFVGAGLGATSNLLYPLITDDTPDAFFHADYESSPMTMTPAFAVGYKYYPSKRWGFGATATIGFEKHKASYNDADFGRVYRRYIGVALESNFTYLYFKYVKLYALAGVGVTIVNDKWAPNADTPETTNLYCPDFQVTPIGVKVGNRFGGYLEAGYGYKGIVSVGFFAKF